VFHTPIIEPLPDYCAFYTLILACGNCRLAKVMRALYITINNNKKELRHE